MAVLLWERAAARSLAATADGAAGHRRRVRGGCAGVAVARAAHRLVSARRAGWPAVDHGAGSDLCDRRRAAASRELRLPAAVHRPHADRAGAQRSDRFPHRRAQPRRDRGSGRAHGESRAPTRHAVRCDRDRRRPLQMHQRCVRACQATPPLREIVARLRETLRGKTPSAGSAAKSFWCCSTRAIGSVRCSPPNVCAAR